MCLKSTLINHIEELEHAIVLVLSSNYPYTLGSISMNLINRPTPWENTLYHIFRCMMTACSVNVGDRWPKLIEIQTWCGWYDSISNSSVVPGRPKFYPSGLIIPPRHTPAHPKDGGRAPRTQQGLWRWICSPWKKPIPQVWLCQPRCWHVRRRHVNEFAPLYQQISRFELDFWVESQTWNAGFKGKKTATRSFTKEAVCQTITLTNAYMLFWKDRMIHMLWVCWWFISFIASRRPMLFSGAKKQCQNWINRSTKTTKLRSSKQNKSRNHGSHVAWRGFGKTSFGGGSISTIGGAQKRPCLPKNMENTPQKQHSAWKGLVGILISLWDGLFSGAMSC